MAGAEPNIETIFADANVIRTLGKHGVNKTFDSCLYWRCGFVVKGNVQPAGDITPRLCRSDLWKNAL